jgi:flagellar hook-basal body complex protein FliE
VGRRPEGLSSLYLIQTGRQPSGLSFSQALESLSQTQNESDALVQSLAAGEDVDLHQVMIASEETDINFRIAVAIRDRLVEAYREVMRMAV